MKHKRLRVLIEFGKLSGKLCEVLIDFSQKFYNRTIEISKIDSIDEVNEAILMILTIARTADNVDNSTYKS